MLCLGRKNNESVRIGDIIITVLKGGPVKIGIEAPEHIAIVRTELERAGPWGEWRDYGGQG